MFLPVYQKTETPTIVLADSTSYRTAQGTNNVAFDNLLSLTNVNGLTIGSSSQQYCRITFNNPIYRIFIELRANNQKACSLTWKGAKGTISFSNPLLIAKTRRVISFDIPKKDKGMIEFYTFGTGNYTVWRVWGEKD